MQSILIAQCPLNFRHPHRANDIAVVFTCKKFGGEPYVNANRYLNSIQMCGIKAMVWLRTLYLWNPHQVLGCHLVVHVHVVGIIVPRVTVLAFLTLCTYNTAHPPTYTNTHVRHVTQNIMKHVDNTNAIVAHTKD